MPNDELQAQIKAVLAAQGIPFDTVEVSDEAIKVAQIGLHEATAAIVNALHVSGLRRLDELKSDAPVETLVTDELYDTDATVVTLPR